MGFRMRLQFSCFVLLLSGYSLLPRVEGEGVSNYTTVANGTSEAGNSTTTSMDPAAVNWTQSPGHGLSTWSNSSGPWNFTLDSNSTVRDNFTLDSNVTTQHPSLNQTDSSSSSSSGSNSPDYQPMYDPGEMDGGQHFDAASFVGGIVLAAGVVGLGVFVYKIYETRKGPRSEYSNI